MKLVIRTSIWLFRITDCWIVQSFSQQVPSSRKWLCLLIHLLLFLQCNHSYIDIPSVTRFQSWWIVAILRLYTLLARPQLFKVFTYFVESSIGPAFTPTNSDSALSSGIDSVARWLLISAVASLRLFTDMGPGLTRPRRLIFITSWGVALIMHYIYLAWAVTFEDSTSNILRAKIVIVTIRVKIKIKDQLTCTAPRIILIRARN